jgi:DNA-binding MarR family transcriptional regulator
VTATPSAAAVAAAANLAAPAAALAKPEQAKFIDNYLSYLLSRAGHEVYRAFHTTVHAAGLSSLEWRVLATLSDGDGLTVGDLALVVLAEQSTLTKLLQRMEKAGWLRRGSDASDARRTLVFETPQGRSVVADLLQKAKAHELQLLASFSSTEVAALKKILKALIEPTRVEL